MPIVSESSSSPDRVFDTRRNTTNNVCSLKDGRQRSQVGFRSGSLSPEEQRSIRDLNLTATGALSYIDQLDLEERSGRSHSYRSHPPRIWPVNDRDYTESRFWPTGLSGSILESPYPNGPWIRATHQGCLGVQELSTTGMSSMPSASTLQNIASKLMRNSQPSVSGFNLARFAAEQKDAPSLFRAANYRPRNPRELAGSYLNYLFGIRPTGSDLIRFADLVQRADGGIRRLIASERIKQKSNRTIGLINESGGGDVSQRLDAACSATGLEFSLGPIRLKGARLNACTSTSYNFMNVLFNYSWTHSASLKMFATWEYFVPQPANIESRLDLYREKAKQLLGDSAIRESDVWELTPWTWLSDWFVDIGGLLRYQQGVANNQIVASQSGYSVYEQRNCMVHLKGLVFNKAGIVNAPYVSGVNLEHVICRASVRKHTRRSGSPYSIGPTWNFSTQQWAILGALGFARGPGVPLKRQ